MGTKQADLLDCIDFSCLECLNFKPSNPATNAIKQGYREDDGLVLESDVDEQLLLHIPFNQVVKLHSILVKAPASSGPKALKLYTNRTSMGFSNVNDFPPTDTLLLTPEQVEQGQALPLKYVKFQNVRSLTLFVESNQEGTDTTSISKLVILGSPVETTNMKDLKKIDQGHG